MSGAMAAAAPTDSASLEDITPPMGPPANPPAKTGGFFNRLKPKRGAVNSNPLLDCSNRPIASPRIRFRKDLDLPGWEVATPTSHKGAPGGNGKISQPSFGTPYRSAGAGRRSQLTPEAMQLAQLEAQVQSLVTAGTERSRANGKRMAEIEARASQWQERVEALEAQIQAAPHPDAVLLAEQGPVCEGSTAVAPNATDPTSVVSVNVGGQVFTSTMTTLCRVPGSALAVALQSRRVLDAHGNVFIDRNPEFFADILEWLRDPASPQSVALPLGDRKFDYAAASLGVLEAMVSELRPELIYVVGGVSLDTVERYNPAVDEWQTVQPLPFARHGHSCSNLGTQLIICGGDTEEGQLDSVVSYDPWSDSWEECADLNVRRSHHGCANLLGNVYVVGGFCSSATTEDEFVALNSVERYDCDIESWSLVAPMQHDRSCVGCVALGGFLYAIGGQGVSIEEDGIIGRLLSSAERFSPSVGAWEAIAPLSFPRASHATCVLDGKIYAIGGVDEDGETNKVERYDPATDTWQTVAPLTTARCNLTACCVQGRLYAVGGFHSDAAQLRTTERYDAEADLWEPVATMRFARDCMASARVRAAWGGHSASSREMLSTFLGGCESSSKC